MNLYLMKSYLTSVIFLFFFCFFMGYPDSVLSKRFYKTQDPEYFLLLCLQLYVYSYFYNPFSDFLIYIK